MPQWVLGALLLLPQSVLLVPVNYYRARPGNWNNWQRQSPPRWGNEWGHEWAEKRKWRDRDDDHDRGRGRDNDRHDNRRDGRGPGR